MVINGGYCLCYSLYFIQLRLAKIMKIRVQLIQNSPLHSIPTILLNIQQQQYIFNLIPTLLRHRRNHQLTIPNNTHVFFTKHSIQAVGGISNMLLHAYKAESPSSKVFPKLNVFCDNSMFNYLQKLRFKLGYKILMMSYTNWMAKKYRFGVSNKAYLQRLQNSKDFPHYFANIQQKLMKDSKDKKDYYSCTEYISNQPLRQIQEDIFYFHDKHVNIIPLSRTLKINQQNKCMSYIIIPKELSKSQHIDVVQFTNRTNITDHYLIRQFQRYGIIKTKEGKVYRKEQFLLRENFKPNNIIILHYNTQACLRKLYSSTVLKSYLQNNNPTGLIIHIVEQMSLIKEREFKEFLDKFGKDVKHLWFNKDCIVYENSVVENEFHIVKNQIWQQVLPQFLVNIYLNRLTYHNNHQQHIINHLFPISTSIFYQKMRHFILSKQKLEAFSTNKSVVCSHEQTIIQQLLLKHKKELARLNSLNFQKNSQFFIPKVAFLGTSSGFPTTHRNTMGILLSINEKLNVLLDCGQGTFEQMVDHFPKQSFQQELLKTQIIFITHIHPDHNLGILNLISERKRLMIKHNSKSKLFLILPFNVFNWYIQYNKTVQNLQQYCSVLFTQIVKNRNNQNQLNYIKSYLEIDKEIFPFQNKKKPHFFKQERPQTSKPQTPQRCQKYESEAFQISGKSKQLITKQLTYNNEQNMKSFEALLSQNSIRTFQPVSVIHCPQSYGIIISTHFYKISYSGDTRPSPDFQEKAKNSSLMIHEATFSDQYASLAQQALHSTVFQAITIGRQSKSHKTVLTHFGEKIKWDSAMKDYSQQTIAYYKKHVIYSFDHLSIPLDNMSLLPEITQLVAKIEGEMADILEKEGSSEESRGYKEE